MSHSKHGCRQLLCCIPPRRLKAGKSQKHQLSPSEVVQEPLRFRYQQPPFANCLYQGTFIPLVKVKQGFLKAAEQLPSLLQGPGQRHDSGIAVTGMCWGCGTNPKSSSEHCSAKGSSCLTPKINNCFLIIFKARIGISMPH